MKKKIFVSYAANDKKVQKLIQLLSRKTQGNISISWPIPSQLDFGNTISHTIETKLRQSNIMVLLLTQRATPTNWQLFELGAAKSLGKKIILVNMHGDLENLPLEFSEDYIIDAKNVSLSNLADKIIEKINRS